MFATDYNQPNASHQIKPLKFDGSRFLLDEDTGELIPRLKYDSRGVGRIEKNPFDSRTEARIKRYMMQSASASTLKGERVCKCCRVKVAEKVGIMTGSVSGETRSHYAGLMQCGSVWHCPVCGAKVAERRATELREAFDKAKAKGWHISHLVFTFPHRSGQSLQGNLEAFLSAYKKFWDSKPLRNYVQLRGIEGRIRALEVTYNFSNGWHPHIHLLVFSTSPIPTSDKELLYTHWADKCLRVGLDKPSLRHGLLIQDGSSAGEYINKFADDSKFTGSGSSVTWDMADEMTKLNSKTASKGFTPFDFLRVINSPETFGYDKKDLPRFRALFTEYAKAFKGKSQLEWGRGKNWDLRKKLGMSKGKTDQELVEEQQEEAKCTVVLTDTEWKLVRGSSRSSSSDNRGSLLAVSERDGFEGVAKFLFGLTNPNMSFGDYRNHLVFRTMQDKKKIIPHYVPESSKESQSDDKFPDFVVEYRNQQPVQLPLI